MEFKIGDIVKLSHSDGVWGGGPFIVVRIISSIPNVYVYEGRAELKELNKQNDKTSLFVLLDFLEKCNLTDFEKELFNIK